MKARPGMVGTSVLFLLGSLGLPGSGPSQETATEISYSEASIAHGKVLYQRHCAECHGLNGKALIDVIADATDLTSPQLWYSGTERAEVFSSIKHGAGVSMPPYADEFTDAEIWDLVNFTQSLWPESKRPPLEKEPPKEPRP